MMMLLVSRRDDESGIPDRAAVAPVDKTAVMAPGLLDGMRVLDVSIWRPMPHATQILCDLGAHVLKVEPPGGDPMRGFPELFASVARGKRSVEIDLKSPNGARRIQALVAETDVFCEAWRPGVAARLGLAAEPLRAAHPSLIYCSISGYGQDGPLRDMPGHDLNYQALGGALRRAGESAERPQIPRLPVGDLEAGTLAALAVCAAWARRLATGAGERIDIAMADVVAWWVGPRSGTVITHSAERAKGSPGYGIFRTADQQFISLAPLTEPHLWAAICTALDLDDLAGVPYADRLSATQEIDERLARVIGSLSLDEGLRRLTRAGAPASPLLTPEQAAAHPQFRARHALTRAGSHDVAALPAILTAHPRREAAPVPEIGEHDGFPPRDPSST